MELRHARDTLTLPLPFSEFTPSFFRTLASSHTDENE